MKYKSLCFLLFLIAFPCHINTNAQEYTRISRIIPDELELFRDITYASYRDTSLRLDVYRPGELKNEFLPVILVIRGGGWAMGDKEGFAPIAAALAEKGFATVCMEYRTSNQAPFPAAVTDTKLAVKWIKDNADRYQFNAASIGAIGGSAGAHLATLLGVSAHSPALNPSENEKDYQIHAVVGLATPFDLTSSPGGEAVIRWIGKPYIENENLWKTASPVNYIAKDSPPMLLIHSSGDNVVPFGQSLLAMEKLGQAGVHAELILIPDAPHAFWNFEAWFGATMEMAASFFQEQLQP